MKWFGWKSGRDDARPALSRSELRRAWAGDWPAGYEAQVRAAYLANPVAQRAVKLVAESVGNAALEVSEPAVAALLAARPGGVALLETVAAQIMLHGNAFVQVVTGEAGVAALFPLRPERVTVEADSDGWPAAYRYRVGERVTRLIADPVRPEVIHLRAFNPLDDQLGSGCLGAAAAAVAIHNAAARWNKALLDNAARPSGALVYDPGDGSTLSPDQFARLRSEMDASFAGSGNAGRPMLLEGGLKWQALSLSPADMDFVGLKAAAAREIALAFGVPPMLLGLPGDSTHANYKEANRALWRLTVMPMAGSILTGLMQGLSGWFVEPAARVDYNQVPALAEDRAHLWRSVSAADFLTDDEKRKLVGVA